MYGLSRNGSSYLFDFNLNVHEKLRICGIRCYVLRYFHKSLWTFTADVTNAITRRTCGSYNRLVENEEWDKIFFSYRMPILLVDLLYEFNFPT